MYPPPLSSLSSRRLTGIFIFFLLIFTGIALRLYVLQIIHADFFAQLAHQQYTATVTLPSQRGALHDRHGAPLALTQQKLSAFIDRNTVVDTAALEQFLKTQFPLVHQQWLSNPAQSFFWVARHISTRRQEALTKACSAIHFMFEPSRWYAPPYTPEVTGFTNIDTKGIAGIERAADEQLAGAPITMRSQKESAHHNLHFVQRIISPGAHGSPLTLTIDQQLHFLLSQELEDMAARAQAKRGTALVLDPTNGHIIAMVQTPSYNPNNPAQTKQEHRKNHLIGSCHELGSLMHLFSVLAALAEGQTTPDELVNCEGKAGYIDGIKIENDTPQGTIPLWQALTHSSNVGIAKICKRMGTLLYDNLNRLGFGMPTNVELPGERGGFVNPPERWSASSPLQISCGYDLMATVLQVAKGLCVIANNGTAVHPTLYSDKRIQRSLQLYDHEPISQMKEMMRRSAEHHGCTLPGYTVMAKMGSARMLKNGRYSHSEHLLSCAGIVEKDGYKRVIISTLEQAKQSARSQKTMAQLLTRLARMTVLHERICPPPKR